MLIRAQQLQHLAAIYEGLAICSVDPGSLTDQLGVRASDVLLELNGQRVRSTQDYKRARDATGEPREALVMRSGRAVRLPIRAASPLN